jgi:hypothetical protein
MKNKYILPILIIIIIIIAIAIYKNEGFGTSPGTLVQLESSHVPTKEDLY